MSPNTKVKLPDLKHDFNHALITGAQFGPHREATITVQKLEWVNDRGYYSPESHIRFSGIVNLNEVQLFFTKQFKGKRPKGTRPSFDIAWLQYDESQKSKPGNLFIEIACERTDGRVVIQCSNIQVDE